MGELSNTRQWNTAVTFWKSARDRLWLACAMLFMASTSGAVYFRASLPLTMACTSSALQSHKCITCMLVLHTGHPPWKPCWETHIRPDICFSRVPVLELLHLHCTGILWIKTSSASKHTRFSSLFCFVFKWQSPPLNSYFYYKNKNKQLKQSSQNQNTQLPYRSNNISKPIYHLFTASLFVAWKAVHCENLRTFWFVCLKEAFLLTFCAFWICFKKKILKKKFLAFMWL